MPRRKRTHLKLSDFRCGHYNVRIWEETAWDVNRKEKTADIGEEYWSELPPLCLDCRKDLPRASEVKLIAIVEKQRGNI